MVHAGMCVCEGLHEVGILDSTLEIEDSFLSLYLSLQLPSHPFL